MHTMFVHCSYFRYKWSCSFKAIKNRWNCFVGSICFRM